MAYDYASIGLKIGLEIHQQLNTRKLFCDCSTGMKEKNQSFEIHRKMRPAVGELGKVDRAALFEFLRSREFVYHGYQDEACLVDTDDEPPHQINEEALRIALSLSVMLGLEMPDEIHVMRKTVLDGSAITSFQRTMLVGFGSADFNGVRIKSLCLEEDAAKPQDAKGSSVTYSLSRLGIPLIEMATEPDIKSPEQCLEIAEQLGLLLRSFNVKRGIGTIRQDVNISIEEGSRTEIKGWQDLKTLPTLIENEISRQSSLVNIKNELNERGFKVSGAVDVSDIFGFECYALKLIKFRDISEKELCKGKGLMDELFEYPKANGSSVAMEKSGHYKSEFEKMEKMLECERGDIIVVVHGGEARKAVAALEERVRGLCIGVPEETRKPNPDGTTSFARPLPGSERMYPETDCLPVKITKRMIEKIENSLPKTLNEKKEELEKSLPKEIASQLIRSQYLGIYESMAKKIKSKENLLAVATTFTSTLKDMSRSGIQTDKIPEACFELIFNTLDRGKITAKAIPEILERIANGDNAEAALSSFETLDKDDIEKIISEALRENPNLQISVLMGIVMAKLKGKADGKTVMEILKKMVK